MKYKFTEHGNVQKVFTQILPHALIPSFEDFLWPCS